MNDDDARKIIDRLGKIEQALKNEATAIVAAQMAILEAQATIKLGDDDDEETRISR